MNGAPATRVNCFACVSFFVTYEPNFPYGCRAMGFKSREMPSLSVYASSGMACQMFSPRKKTDPGVPQSP